MHHAKQILVASLVYFASTSTVLADALDGDWCNERDGKLTINGSSIITPSGSTISGNYSRHRFTYRAPEGDWNGGKNIVIQQLNEEAMDLSVDENTPTRWSPCLLSS